MPSPSALVLCPHPLPSSSVLTLRPRPCPSPSGASGASSPALQGPCLLLSGALALRPPGHCLTNDGKNTKHFQPNFPASCPFVTTDGGTTRVNPEVAVSFSGGGFSSYFARPSYQWTAVSTFLTKLGSTNAGQFNATGRAYPDVAAQGQGFQVVIGGRIGSIGRTSASSPTFAGVIALLNDFRLSQGKSSLGFLN